MTKPLEMEFKIDCGAEHAFRIWTEQIDSWWPKSHSKSGENDFSVVLEPFEGGRIFERTANGEEHDWGEVLEWQQPELIRFRWHIAWNRSKATDVTVNFRSSGTATIVHIVQSGWEKFGDEAENFRDRNRGDWTTIVDHFGQFAKH